MSMKLTRRAEITGAACPSYCAVKLDGSGHIVPTDAATDDVYAVTCETSAAASGDRVACEYDGIVKMTASAAIAKGARLMPAADGKVATVVGATSKLVGEALEPASANGARLLVRLYANRRTVLGS